MAHVEKVCLGAYPHHLWRPWKHDRERRLYRMSCRRSGCDAQCEIENLNPATSLIRRFEGVDHVHHWSPWDPTFSSFDDSAWYHRACACGAMEVVEILVPVGLPRLVRGEEYWGEILETLAQRVRRHRRTGS